MQEARELARRSDTDGAGCRKILGDKFRPLLALRSTDGPRADDYREVASTVRGAQVELSLDVAKSGRRTECGSARLILSLCDNCRLQDGMYV
jgi:hypothetical protein